MIVLGNVPSVGSRKPGNSLLNCINLVLISFRTSLYEELNNRASSNQGLTPETFLLASSCC